MTLATLILAAIYIALLLLRRQLALSYAQTLPPLPLAPLPVDTLTIAQAILSGKFLPGDRIQAHSNGNGLEFAKV